MMVSGRRPMRYVPTVTACNRLHRFVGGCNRLHRASAGRTDGRTRTPPTGNVPAYGIIETADDVTDIVVAAMAGARNARLREEMAAFVRHLHAGVMPRRARRRGLTTTPPSATTGRRR